MKTENPRQLLRKYGFSPKARFSQNFLVSAQAVQTLSHRVLKDDKDPWVVELGAGTGTLTAHLLGRGARVIAIEADKDMVHILRSEGQTHLGLYVVEEDAARLDLRALCNHHGIETPPIVAGNLPYAITGAIMRWACDNATQLKRCVFMVQKEVGERLGASPSNSDYGALTVFVQNHFEARVVQRIGRGAFFPQPKVDSVVIELLPRSVPIAPETKAFQATVRAAFDARRKTLRKALSQHLLTIDQTDAALEVASIDGQRRGETLSVKEFAVLAHAVAEQSRLG